MKNMKESQDTPIETTFDFCVLTFVGLTFVVLTFVVLTFVVDTNWIRMPQKLMTGRRNHVAMMVSDQITNCSLP